MATADVDVAYHTYHLISPDIGTAAAPPGDPTENGVVRAARDAAAVHCGTHTGLVRVTVQALPAAPPACPAEWDDIVEVSLTATTAALVVVDGDDGPVEELPNLLVAGPGDYRLRVCVRGRDAGRAADTVEADPPEEHLLQCWPAPVAPPLRLRATDRVGAALRAGPT